MKQEGHWKLFHSLSQQLKAKDARFPELDAAFIAWDEMLDTAIKFYVPELSASVINKADLREPIHIPYPTIAILSETDFQYRDLETSRLYENYKSAIVRKRGYKIITAVEVKDHPHNINFYTAVYQPDIGLWQTTPILGGVTFIEQRGLCIGIHKDPSTQHAINRTAELTGYSRDRITLEAEENATVDAYTLLDMYRLLSVHDTTVHKVESPSKLRQKLITKGRSRFYDYHVLSIGGEVWDSPHEHTGTGEGKRSHLRRGHIRRLASKTVWVRSTFVHGSKEGFVKKDYEVKGTSNAVQEPQGS